MDSDWERLQTRMGILIQRILKKHCAAFEGADVCMHIPHRYSKESSKKSEIVSAFNSFLNFVMIKFSGSLGMQIYSPNLSNQISFA